MDGTSFSLARLLAPTLIPTVYIAAVTACAQHRRQRRSTMTTMSCIRIRALLHIFICMILLHETRTLVLNANKELPKLFLVDRDGVINQDIGPPGVLCPTQLQLLPGAGVALGKLRRAGCKVAVITNQSCVGKGLVTEENLVRDIHGKLREMLLQEDPDAIVDVIFYCTSLRDSGDYRMKPNPGMIVEAEEMFGIPASKAIFIGDALRDLEAAASAGVQVRILVETGYGRGVMHGKSAPTCEQPMELVTQGDFGKRNHGTESPSILPFYYAKNLLHAVESVLSHFDA